MHYALLSFPFGLLSSLYKTELQYNILKFCDNVTHWDWARLSELAWASLSATGLYSILPRYYMSFYGSQSSVMLWLAQACSGSLCTAHDNSGSKNSGSYTVHYVSLVVWLLAMLDYLFALLYFHLHCYFPPSCCHILFFCSKVNLEQQTIAHNAHQILNDEKENPTMWRKLGNTIKQFHVDKMDILKDPWCSVSPGEK